jgi:hypothetical protein
VGNAIGWREDIHSDSLDDILRRASITPRRLLRSKPRSMAGKIQEQLVKSPYCGYWSAVTGTEGKRPFEASI